MLPKGVLGRNYYRRLYIYRDDKINYRISKKDKESMNNPNPEDWIKFEVS